MKDQAVVNLELALRPAPRAASRSATAAPRALFGSAVRPEAPLTQKDRALLRLALAMGRRLEPEVRVYVRRAAEAGWTAAQINYAAEVATKTFPSPEMLSATLWVAEVLKKIQAGPG